jgi:hypothetical protein
MEQQGGAKTGPVTNVGGRNEHAMPRSFLKLQIKKQTMIQTCISLVPIALRRKRNVLW